MARRVVAGGGDDRPRARAGRGGHCRGRRREPASRNIDSGRGLSTLDFRHDTARAGAHGAALRKPPPPLAEPQGRHHPRPLLDRPPVRFDPELIEAIAPQPRRSAFEPADRLGRRPRRLLHGVGRPNRHDLRALQGRHQPQRGRGCHPGRLRGGRQCPVADGAEARRISPRHGWPCASHPRLSFCGHEGRGCPATSAGMTGCPPLRPGILEFSQGSCPPPGPRRRTGRWCRG